MKNTIKRQPIDKIRELPYNPTIRTTRTKLSDLVAYMRDRQGRGLEPLPESERLLIGNDGYLGDGHRRLAALKVLGVSDVWVEIDSTRTAAEIWRDRNSGQPLNANQVTAAGRSGLDETYWPARIRQSADQLRSLAGEESIAVVLESGFSLSIVSPLRTVANYCGRHDQPFVLALLRWMICHNAVRLARSVADYRLMPPASLIAAVTENRPLQIL